MPLKARLERQIFKKDGRYFQRKKAIEEGKKNSLKHQRALKASESAYVKGLAKAEKLKGTKKIRFLEDLETLIYQKGVMPTYDAEKSEKKIPQSPAHMKASHMTADIRMRIWEAQEALKKKR